MKYNMILIFWAVVTLNGSLHAQSERSLIRDGNRLYNDKKYADAEVNFRKALEKNKEVKEGIFNLGDALYKQQRFDESAEQYRRSAESIADPRLKAQAYHNYGNALLKSKKYEESLGAYKEALKYNPKDEDTKYNYEYARQLLKQQQQQQQQKQQNKDQKNDKQKQDRQQQEQQKKDQEQKEQQKQEQQKQDQQQQKQAQQKKQQISKQDAERILEALKNEDRDTQKKLHKKVPVRVKIKKDW
jgi:Ca-activated chloride channel family protein